MTLHVCVDCRNIFVEVTISSHSVVLHIHSSFTSKVCKTLVTIIIHAPCCMNYVNLPRTSITSNCKSKSHWTIYNDWQLSNYKWRHLCRLNIIRYNDTCYIYLAGVWEFKTAEFLWCWCHDFLIKFYNLLVYLILDVGRLYWCSLPERWFLWDKIFARVLLRWRVYRSTLWWYGMF